MLQTKLKSIVLKSNFFLFDNSECFFICICIAIQYRIRISSEILINSYFTYDNKTTISTDSRMV